MKTKKQSPTKDRRGIFHLVMPLGVSLLATLAMACPSTPATVTDAGSTQVTSETQLPWAPKTAADLPPTTSHLLDGMDNGTPLSDGELAGRNAWTLWTAGNHRFWDYRAPRIWNLGFLANIVDPT